MIPLSDGAHLADALVSLFLGDVSIAAAGELSHGLLHSRYPFQSVAVGVCRSSMVLLYHKMPDLSTPFHRFSVLHKNLPEQLEFFVQSAGGGPVPRFSTLKRELFFIHLVYIVYCPDSNDNNSNKTDSDNNSKNRII